MFRIQITNIGKKPYNLIVCGDENFKREAVFASPADAEEGCRIVRALRVDSAFVQAIVIKD